ncbi:MAG: TlpA disulfide reductase family protein [Calditrichota bacterium]
MIWALKIVSVFLLFTILVSCQGEKDKEVDQKNRLFSEPPRVDLLNEDSLENLLKVRNDKALFLNVWATWCIPCREEFPDIVRFSREYKNRNIEFVGLSADFPDEIESKIIPFLQDQKVDFRIFVQNFKHQEDLINRLNPDWRGALPATFLYNEKGELIKFMLGKQSYQDFKQAMDSVLKSP